MSIIKMIAMDMDGTLLNADHQITEYTLSALREAREAGIELVLSSGRIPGDASVYAMNMGLPDMKIISMNGACWLDRPFGTIHNTRMIEESASRDILCLTQKYGLNYGAFNGNHLISDETADANDVTVVWATNMFNEKAGCSIAFCGEGIQSYIKQGLNKWVIMDKMATGKLRSMTEELRLMHPELEITSSWWSNIEINAPGVSKGNALRSLADHLHIPMVRVMAIGDNSNDVSMLKACHYGVAMGNGTQEAFDAASYITLNNNLNGVGHAIRVLALEQNVGGVRKLL